MSRKGEIEIEFSDHRFEVLDPRRMAEYTEDLQELLEEGDVCERKSFIKGFVKQISVRGDEVTLEYTPPLPGSNGKHEKVLSIGGSGGPIGLFITLRASNRLIRSQSCSTVALSVCFTHHGFSGLAPDDITPSISTKAGDNPAALPNPALAKPNPFINCLLLTVE